MDFENDYEPGYHDELERDWDERYEHEPFDDSGEDAYLDAAYEDRYDLGDY